MRGVACVALLAFVLAGCAGTSGTAGDVAAPMVEQTPPPAVAEVEAAAGRLRDEVQVVPVSFVGRLPAGAVWAGPLGHVGPTFGMQHAWTKEVAGTVEAAELVMMWEGGATTSRLDLALAPLEERDGVKVLGEDMRRVSGTSPLALTVEGLGWTQGEYVVFGWWPDEPGVRLEAVEFHVEGALLALVPGEQEAS